MKKNSKRILVALLAAAMALSMTACSEEPAEDASSSEPESSVSEQVSEPETSDLEVEDDTSSDAETETSDPAADNTSSAADTVEDGFNERVFSLHVQNGNAQYSTVCGNQRQEHAQCLIQCRC